MVSLPTTHDSNATSLGHVSNESDWATGIEGNFKIVNFAAFTMTLRFDAITSVGWALRQALNNKEWLKPRGGPP